MPLAGTLNQATIRWFSFFSGTWTKGFNFRATSGYVVDGADETYVIATDTYPTTRNGVTFGWEDTANLENRDRTTSQDRRLAGINFTSTGSIDRFRVDLPATGTYIIRLALGDTVAQSTAKVEIKDNITSLFIIGPHAVTGTKYWDASDVERTAAAWPTDNISVQQTFGSMIFRAHLGNSTGVSPLAHIYISNVVVSGHPYYYGLTQNV